MDTFVIGALVGTVISATWGYVINPRLEKRSRASVFVKPIVEFDTEKEKSSSAHVDYS